MSPFRILFREFFGQFFRSESSTSDIRLRQTLIGVLAFLLTPGYFIALSSFNAFAAAQARAPHLLEPMRQILSGIFLAFSTVSIGLIAAFTWDALSFDRRDAMVLGPLPVSRATVVRAKLSAMGAFLMGICVAINLPTAFMFAMAASNGFAMAGRHFAAHMIATSCAAILTFSAIVILRALVGMVARGHFEGALASLLQFAFVSAILCGIILMPETLGRRPRRGGPETLQVAAPQPWLTSNGFAAVYGELRGVSTPESSSTARRTEIVTLTAFGAAILLTIGGYRRHLQNALTPSASAGAVGGARISRALARAFTGTNRRARATSDFVLLTLVRSRAQQSPIAINAAIGLAEIALEFAGHPGSLAADLRDPALVLSVPLTLLFWIGVGIRASFFVPSDLPAAWMFRSNAPENTPAYALGTRAATIALAGPPVGLFALGVAASILNWSGAVPYACFVLLLVAAFADFIALTVNHIPFARTYEPGHAKLKSRWPLYLFGSIGFGRGLANLELYASNEPHGLAILLTLAAAAVVVFELALRTTGRAAAGHTVHDEPEEDQSAVTVLDLGSFSRHRT